MRSHRDRDDLVTHPLKRPLLTEYETYLARVIGTEVSAGTFTPGRSYPCTVSKPSGGLRDLVFPSLMDSIVGRHTINALEEDITKDDDERAFCGRSHASTNRAPGDYDSWFQVWRDYTASIARASELRGYAYVFTTDVAHFFPSIDRVRARLALEKRTRAGSAVSALLFHCLESWLVHYEYEKGPGLPIEPHDVSRLVAHNYLKPVDEAFSSIPNVEYARFADDTVILVKDRPDAQRVMQKHHEALAHIGLAPNAAKTQILHTTEYEEQRHVEINRRIEDLHTSFDEEDFASVVSHWYQQQCTAPNWSRVTKRLYTEARKQKSHVMREHALKDLSRYPELADHALQYLTIFPVAERHDQEIIGLWGNADIHSERLIGLSKFLCNARFESDQASTQLADFAVYRIRRPDDRPGSSYARALLLLCLFKHGKRHHRKKVFKWGTDNPITDPQIRHHFLYVFTATGDVTDSVMHGMRPLLDSDAELTLRLCRDARSGSLQKRDRLLHICSISTAMGTIEARYLPLLHIILAGDGAREESALWINKQLLGSNGGPAELDSVVVDFLRRMLQKITE